MVGNGQCFGACIVLFNIAACFPAKEKHSVRLLLARPERRIACDFTRSYCASVSGSPVSIAKNSSKHVFNLRHKVMALESGEPNKGDAPDIFVNIPEDETTGYELRGFFGDVESLNMAELWRRISEGDYEGSEEKDLIVSEMLHFNNLTQRKLRDHELEWWSSKLCCSQFKPEFEVSMPLGEKKRQWEAFRSFSLQILLELLTFATDILFLVELDKIDPQLARCSFYSLYFACFIKVMSGIRLKGYVNPSQFVLFNAGVLLSLVEPNSGLALIRMTFRYRENSRNPALKCDFKSPHAAGVAIMQDPVAAAAARDSAFGWSELRNIFATTIVEDLAQLLIQLAFYTRHTQEVNTLFHMNTATTVLHMIFRWIEAAITVRYLETKVGVWNILGPLGGPKLASLIYGRDVVTTKDSILRFRDKNSYTSIANICRGDIKRYLQASWPLSTMIGIVDLCLRCFTGCVFCTSIPFVNCKRFSSAKRVEPEEMGDVDQLPLLSKCQVGEFIAEHKMNIRMVTSSKYDAALQYPIISSVLNACHTNIITHLDLGGVNLEETDMSHLCKLQFPALFQLNLSRTKITDTGLLTLTQWSQCIVNLGLGETCVSDSCIRDVLKQFPKLRVLHLHSTKVSSQTILTLAEICIHLEAINLTNTIIGISCIEALVGLRKLRRIYLGWCKQLTDMTTVCRLLGGCKNLESLDLSGCPLTDEAILHVIERCPLKTLWVDDTEVTETGLLQIIVMCNQLRIFSVAQLNMTNRLLCRLCDSCIQLKSLGLRGTPIDDTGAMLLARLVERKEKINQPILRQVDLTNTKVTTQGLLTLLRQLPFRQRLHGTGIKLRVKGTEVDAEEINNSFPNRIVDDMTDSFIYPYPVSQ